MQNEDNCVQNMDMHNYIILGYVVLMFVLSVNLLFILLINRLIKILCLNTERK